MAKPVTRRTITLTGKNQLQLVEDELPPPGPDELRVQTTRSLISTGTESICYTRNFAPGTHWDAWVRYPFAMGYLNAGRVIDVGANIAGWKVGDRVASRVPHRSFYNVAAQHAVRVPDGVSDEAAAWMGLGKITQIGVRAAEHRLGDSVAIVGLGLLGQLVTQYCRLMGARDVIAIDLAPMRLEMAKVSGATHSIQATAADALPRVKEITDGRLADVVYEVTGHPAVFATALPLARRFGTVVLLGDAGDPSKQTLTNDIVVRGLKVVGAHETHPVDQPHQLVRWSAVQMHELFLHYVARREIRLDHLVTNRYRPEQASEVYEMLQRERDKAMGVVFEWDEG